MDAIHIRDLAIECIIGTEEKERKTTQTVVINLTLECDLAKASRTDWLEDTLDYKALKQELAAFISRTRFFLIEKLAAEIASFCLKKRPVSSVQVTVDKPGALTGARSVAVELKRSNRKQQA
ncbi:MAG: dihydroneopterin aldolase [Kiritimatiellia bacterium]